MSMGIAFVFVYAYFASLLYPGVNLPLTVGVALLPGIVFSIVYYLFTVAMPRTGGDYVWVSRIVHPAVGYLGNFFITFTLFTIVGTVAAWVPIYGLGPLFVGLGLIRGGNSEYLTLAFKLSSPPFSFAIAAVLVVLFVVPLFFSLKSTYRLLGALCYYCYWHSRDGGGLLFFVSRCVCFKFQFPHKHELREDNFDRWSSKRLHGSDDSHGIGLHHIEFHRIQFLRILHWRSKGSKTRPNNRDDRLAFPLCFVHGSCLHLCIPRCWLRLLECGELSLCHWKWKLYSASASSSQSPGHVRESHPTSHLGDRDWIHSSMCC